MTQDDIDQIRRNSVIEAELKILEAVTFSSFSCVVSPNLLGSKILESCIERIRTAMNGKEA